MIIGKQDELCQMVKTHGCPEHPNAMLTVAWHPPEGYVIRCGENHYPEEIKAIPTLTELRKEGQDLGQPINDRIDRNLAKRGGQSPEAATLPALTGIPPADLATGESVTIEVRRALAAWAASVGLRPELGHVALMYGKPYVEASGYLYHARQSRLSYDMEVRPLSVEERPTYQIPEGAHAWLCNITIKPDGTHVMGLGIVTLDEINAMSPKHPDKHRSPVVAAHPWHMAKKRAEHQALERAFPLGEEPNNIAGGQ